MTSSKIGGTPSAPSRLRTLSDQDKWHKKKAAGGGSGKTISDQDIKKFAAKLHASIGAAMGAGSTLSALKAAINATKVKKQVPHRGTGPKPKAYGGKIKKKARGGKVKKRK